MRHAQAARTRRSAARPSARGTMGLTGPLRFIATALFRAIAPSLNLLRQVHSFRQEATAMEHPRNRNSPHRRLRSCSSSLSRVHASILRLRFKIKGAGHLNLMFAAMGSAMTNRSRRTEIASLSCTPRTTAIEKRRWPSRRKASAVGRDRNRHHRDSRISYRGTSANTRSRSGVRSVAHSHLMRNRYEVSRRRTERP